MSKKGEEWILSPEKRSIDLAIATSMAPIALPAIAMSGVAVGLADRVNPRFSQERIGQNLDPFVMRKIRTMPHVAENVPSVGYMDDRASKIGRILRKTHIDELPQGFQILRGKMSVVGPRPILPQELEGTLEELSLSEQKDWLHARSLCRPGVVFTYGVHQHGRGEKLTYRSRAALDIEYADGASFKTDGKLLLQSFLHTKSDLLGIDINEKQGHPQTIEVFTKIANSFGVSIQESDAQYWRAMLNACRAFDTIVDGDQPDSIDEELRYLTQGYPIPGFTEEEAQEFQQVFDSLDDDRRAAIAEGVKINDLAKKIRSADNVHSLISLRKEESKIFAKIMQLENKADDPSRSVFNDWLIKFSEAGYLLDSFIDLSQDFENGIISLRPNIVNRTILLREVLAELGSLDLPKQVWGHLALAGIGKSVRSILNDQHKA